jgi:hypothetical protein
MVETKVLQRDCDRAIARAINPFIGADREESLDNILIALSGLAEMWLKYIDPSQDGPPVYPLLRALEAALEYELNNGPGPG